MRPLSAYTTEAALAEHIFALDHHSTDAFLLRVSALYRIAKMPDRREGEFLCLCLFLTLTRAHTLNRLLPSD